MAQDAVRKRAAGSRRIISLPGVTFLVGAEERGIVPTPRHGFEGTQSRVFRQMVDPATGKSIGVATVCRPKGIDDMHSRGRITDRQKEAADRFLMTYERAHSDGMKAIDYSKVRVDGGRFSAGATMTKLDAQDQLARIERHLGKAAYDILEMTAGRQLSLDEARSHLPVNGRGEMMTSQTLSKKLKMALDALDRFWNTSRNVEDVGASNSPRRRLRRHGCSGMF